MKVREIVALLTRDGWRLVRIRGSHHHYRHPTKPGVVTVPGSGNDDLLVERSEASSSKPVSTTEPHERRSRHEPIRDSHRTDRLRLLGVLTGSPRLCVDRTHGRRGRGEHAGSGGRAPRGAPTCRPPDSSPYDGRGVCRGCGIGSVGLVCFCYSENTSKSF